MEHPDPSPVSRRRLLQWSGGLATGAAAAVTAPAPAWAAAPTIAGLTLSSSTPRAGEPLTLTADVTAAYANPDDPSQVEVFATVTDPNGTARQVPGFLLQPYRVDGTRVVTDGAPRWTVRYTARLQGPHTVRMGVRTPAGQAQSATRTVDVQRVRDSYRGFIRINPAGRKYFQRVHTGEMFFPIGLNADIPEFTRDANFHDTPESRYHGILGDGEFNPARGASPEALYEVFDTYRRAVDGLASGGGNVLRLRLDSWWLPLELDPDYEVPGYPQGVPGFSVGRYHPANAWIVDQVLEQAQQRGLAVSLCTWNGNSAWGDSTYAYDENAALVDRRLRYQVARWGYSPALWAFELFNEVSRPGSTRPTDVDIDSAFWRTRVERLRALDVNNHPVFNSYEGIDQREAHTYVRADENFLYWGNFDGKDDEPFTLTEYGKLRYFLDEVDADPQGRKAHEAAWASVFGHKSGALYWWLYPHVEPLDLYGDIYGALAGFLEGEQLAGPDWQAAVLTTQSGPGGLTLRGMVGDRSRALVWAVRTPSNEVNDRAPADGNVLRLGALDPGTYDVTWTDTVSGDLLRAGTGTVAPRTSTLRLNVPPGVGRAAAAKIRRA